MFNDRVKFRKTRNSCRNHRLERICARVVYRFRRIHPVPECNSKLLDAGHFDIILLLKLDNSDELHFHILDTKFSLFQAYKLPASFKKKTTALYNIVHNDLIILSSKRLLKKIVSNRNDIDNVMVVMERKAVASLITPVFVRYPEQVYCLQCPYVMSSLPFYLYPRPTS